MRDEANRLATIPLVSAQTEEAIQSDPPEIAPAPILEQAAEIEQEAVAEAPAPQPKRAARMSAAEKPPAYERIQSQDGKVYYRKVQ